jgi:hypothetical protein
MREEYIMLPNEVVYDDVLNAKPAAVDKLSLEQRMMAQQIWLLKSINSKLTFFTVVLILSLIVTFISSL